MAESCRATPLLFARLTRQRSHWARVLAPGLLAIVTALCCNAPLAHAIPPAAPVTAGPATGGGGTAAAPPADAKATFEEAVNSFRYQDFDNAVPQLRSLLYPTLRVDRRREWQAREYLGAALWWTGVKNEANDEFTALLVRDGAHKLDPAVYPPKMVSDFDALRGNLVRLGIIKADVIPVDPSENAQEPPPFGLMFVPLGVGQFANRSPGKGAVFLATEVALAAVSATFYVINQQDGLQGPGHMTQANQIAQLSAGGAFFAVAVVGIIDAVVHWNDVKK